MRLSKKIAAVALAAVMAVSMLTACGGTDAPSSSSPSSSSPSSSSSGSGSSGSGSSSNSTSDSSSSSNSGTDDKEENVAYQNSRTGRFYRKLGTSFTMGVKMNATIDGVNQTSNVLISTNGNRVYEEFWSDDGDIGHKIILMDQTKRQGWLLIPDEDVEEPGKLGYYQTLEIGNNQTGGGTTVKPIEGIKFTQRTEGNYYIESQTYEVPSDDGTVKVSMAYYFVRNSDTPKFVVVDESVDGKALVSMRMEFTSVEYQANKKYMDFESLLKQYVNISEKYGAASMPSIASLTIG